MFSTNFCIDDTLFIYYKIYILSLGIELRKKAKKKLSVAFILVNLNVVVTLRCEARVKRFHQNNQAFVGDREFKYNISHNYFTYFYVNSINTAIVQIRQPLPSASYM